MNAWSVSSNTAASRLVCFLEGDAIEQHHHQQPSAAAVLVRPWSQSGALSQRGVRVTWCTSLPSTRIVKMSGWPERPLREKTIRAPLGENEADSNIVSALTRVICRKPRPPGWTT